ncbi:MAG TPA: 2-amino-4-hydroxy-6-hydroxymethyldihydropteridine diphosphokinase [Myxococcaceae bacterium]|nr:2-amino-4-hydroxy-6-hydroxymethyldihydropteridine diphosphokinase [Myxococcaceae bacterium]
MSDNVYIGLGANLGDREQQLLAALESLSHIDAAAVLRCSSLYESAPMGPPQPRYLNAVVELECALAPLSLLAILKQIELDLGRTKSERWGPRAIDLDVLLWGEQVIAEARLQVPHLELHRRRFALEPLCELNPNARHPVLGESVSNLLERVQLQDVVKLSSSEWPYESAGQDP